MNQIKIIEGEVYLNGKKIKWLKSFEMKKTSHSESEVTLVIKAKVS